MSKERELLKKIVDYMWEGELVDEIKELLAQPEQTEQEPEAWIVVNKETGYRTQVSDLTPFLYNREIFEVIPLYLAPPKREPLSNEQKRLEVIAIKQREAHGFGGGE